MKKNRTEKKNPTGNRIFTFLIFAFLYAPILLLVIFSFNEGTSSAVWSGFSLHWYKELFQDRLIIQSINTTLMVSILATIFATIAGTIAAVGFYSLRRRPREILTTVNNLPMMNADIVTAVSLCLFFVAFFSGWKDFSVWFNSIQSLITLPERLTLGFGTLLIAHITFDIPYVLLSVSPRLRQMDKNLVDAALDLGCTRVQAFWKVVIPEIKPGIVSGALIAFTMSIDDFVISYFTAGSSSSTLAMTIYGMTKKRVTPVINAVSTLLFLTVLLLLVIKTLRESRIREKNERRKHLPSSAEAAVVARENERRSRAMLPKVAGGIAAIVLVAFSVSLFSGNANQRSVNVCSWGQYIDKALITQFEEETGITVNYQTTESNEALYSLLKSGAGDYDVIVPSDYMIGQLIEEGMLEELDFSKIPNYSLVGDQFRGLEFDPQDKYSVPYAWSTVGIIYNPNMVTETIHTWDVMFDDTYAGNVLMFRNSRDAIGLALLELGYSLNTTDLDELAEAYDLLADSKERGVYQAFVMDEICQKLEGGNAALGPYYAGDYLFMLENNPDLKFVIPDEGSNWFVDSMCILKDAPHQEEALEWINFITSTEASLKNMDYIGCASPNVEALEQYPTYYEELYDEPLDPDLYEIIAAPAETLERCETYSNLPRDIRILYNDMWTRLGI